MPAARPLEERRTPAAPAAPFSPRLPLRAAWTVTLLLSLGLWGTIWLVVTAIG
jgi:hypothetical protein